MGDTVEMRPKRRGNYKPGPGRPKGRKNNATLALEAAAQEAAASIDGAFEGDAHAFLVAVYRNPAVPLELRIMAASRALKVEKPALSAGREQIDVTLNIAARMEAAQKRIAAMHSPASIVDHDTTKDYFHPVIEIGVDKIA
jgi:hypothetical protein